MTNEEVIRMIDKLIEERKQEIKALELLKKDPDMFFDIQWTKGHKTSL